MDGADIRIPPPDDIEGCGIDAPALMPPMCIGAGEERGSILGLGMGLSLCAGGAIRTGAAGMACGGAAAGSGEGVGRGETTPIAGGCSRGLCTSRGTRSPSAHRGPFKRGPVKRGIGAIVTPVAGALEVKPGRPTKP
jgi:hypothetical protein